MIIIKCDMCGIMHDIEIMEEHPQNKLLVCPTCFTKKVEEND